MNNYKEMTKTEYAAHRGITQAAVSKLIRQDSILITPDDKVDVEISDMMLDKFSDSPKREDLIDRLDVMGDYSLYRTELTKHKAELAKIDLDKARNKVVDAEEVRTAAFDTARRTRDALLNLKDKLPPLLAPETDIHKIYTILDREFSEVLSELYNQFIPRSVQ